jgi:hypothetical protein
MPVKITSERGKRVAISLDEDDLVIMLRILLGAKFGRGMSLEYLLAPLLSELIAEVLNYGNIHDIRMIKLFDDAMDLSEEVATAHGGFVKEIRDILGQEFGAEVDEHFGKALFPYRYPKTDVSPG